MSRWVGKYLGPDLAMMFDPGPAEHAAREMAERGGDRLHERIVDLTPIRTGNLATSWDRTRVKHRGRAYWSSVQTSVKYAPYPNYGTRPHLIRPIPPNEWLVWRDPRTGQWTRRREVHHPGNEPQYFVEKAVSLVAGALEETMREPLEAWKRQQEALVLAAQVRL